MKNATLYFNLILFSAFIAGSVRANPRLTPESEEAVELNHKQRINRIISAEAYKANLEEKQNLMREKRSSLYAQFISWLKNLFSQEDREKQITRSMPPSNLFSGSGAPARFIFWIVVLIATGILLYILLRFAANMKGKSRVSDNTAPLVVLDVELPWAKAIETIYRHYLKKSELKVQNRLPPSLTLAQARAYIVQAKLDDEFISGLGNYLETRLFSAHKPNDDQNQYWENSAVKLARELNENIA